MSVDLAVIMEHHLSAEQALQLPARFDASGTLAAASSDLRTALAPRWPNLPKRASWKSPIESADAIRLAWQRNELLLLDDGVGAQLTLGQRAIELSFIERFVVFVENLEGLQLPMRRYCRAVAQDLGSARAIYMPDSTYPMSIVLDLVFEGASFDEIQRRLTTEFGAPAPTIGSIYSEGPEGYTVNGYFVDDFSAVTGPIPI